MIMLTKDNPIGADSVKDVDFPSRTVQSYVSAWARDAIGDVFQQGAWKKSITERGPKGKNRVWVLADHWPEKRLSKPSEITEDDTGLLFTFKLPETTLGNDTLTMYREGFISEHSVGFDLVKGKYAENDGGGLDIEEAVLWEGSVVTWGMNEHTPTLNVRSLTTERVVAEAAKVDRAIRLLDHGTFYTDGVPEGLQAYLTQVSDLLHDILTTPAEAGKRIGSEPGQETTPSEPDHDTTLGDAIQRLYNALHNVAA